MVVLVTCQNDEDPFKNESTQLTIVAGQVWPKIKLIKAFIVVLDTCKNDEDPFKNESKRVPKTFLPF